MDEAPTLESAMDAFAQTLLEKARVSDSLPDALKVFETVGRYLEQKAKGKPAAVAPADTGRKGAKFANLRAEFNGNGAKAPRGGRRGAPAPDDGETAGNA